MMLKKYDLTGKTFGRLVVLERKGTDKNRVSVWLCRCSCGTELPVTGANLRHDVTHSCGCLQREKAKEMGKDIARRRVTPIVAIRNKYINGARQRNIAFDLTENEVDFLVNKNCYYCDASPLSGIDRINSNDYYHLDNCVPCCKKCNTMKMSLERDDFVEHVRKIAKHMEYR